MTANFFNPNYGYDILISFDASLDNKISHVDENRLKIRSFLSRQQLEMNDRLLLSVVWLLMIQN